MEGGVREQCLLFSGTAEHQNFKNPWLNLPDDPVGDFLRFVLSWHFAFKHDAIFLDAIQAARTNVDAWGVLQDKENARISH